MKKRILTICAFATAIALSYFYGLASHKYYLTPFPQLMEIKNHMFPGSIGYSDASSRTQVPCGTLRGKRVMVALAFGQSNSGNHGETLFKPRKGVYNFFKGRCYVAEDPLLGPTGDRGSVWTRLGDLLTTHGLYDKVVFIPIGVGSTTIDQWTAGGYLHSRIADAIRDSNAAGLKITHIFWVQGGSEKRSSGDNRNKMNYKNNFLKMLRSMRAMGVDAPAYVAVSTYNGVDGNRDIQEAQRELADPHNNIFRGPDDDLLYKNRSNEWEQVHLSGRGLAKCAAAWLEAIRNVEKHN
jgi:hypothetical protein